MHPNVQFAPFAAGIAAVVAGGALWVAAGALAPSVLAEGPRPDTRAASAKPPASSSESSTRSVDDGAWRSMAKFVEQHCVRCHGPHKQEGKLALHQLEGDFAPAAKQALWLRIGERIQAGEMPPPAEPRPSAAAVRDVLAWIDAGLARFGKSLPLGGADDRIAAGNLLDHAALFDPSASGLAASPVRLWRMSPQIYETFARRLSKDAKTAQPFSASPGEGFQDFAAWFVIDEPTIGQLFRNADAIVAVQTRPKGGLREFAPLFATDAPPSREQVATAVRKQFELVLRRPPTAEELARFHALYDRNLAVAGREIAGRSLLATVLMLPEALYRLELGRSDPDPQGRRMLAPRDLAFAIGYALADSGPDAPLLKAAEEGRLATRADVIREVQRLLADPKFAKPRIMRFFDEYFGYPAAIEVFKDVPKGMEWRPEVFVTDTRLLIQYILDQDRDVLRELLTTNKSFVNYNPSAKGGPAPARIVNTNRAKELAEAKQRNKEPPPLRPEYHEVYHLPPDWPWTAEQPIELPRSERAGILTQPSWLAAFGTNNENHAIRRGKWIREHLLGGHIPDLPITVDAQLPDRPEQTLRARMEVTREAYCWQCHQRMNPLGLTLEHYDYLGRFRTEEPVLDPIATAANLDSKGRPLGPVLRGVTIDATGQITASGDPQLDGDVLGFVPMIHKLAASERVRQVFVRHAFRYWMGRNETINDATTLIAADMAYVESQGSMRGLIVALLSSDAFLYRVEPRSAPDRAEE